MILNFPSNPKPLAKLIIERLTKNRQYTYLITCLLKNIGCITYSRKSSIHLVAGNHKIINSKLSFKTNQQFTLSNKLLVSLFLALWLP